MKDRPDWHASTILSLIGGVVGVLIGSGVSWVAQDRATESEHREAVVDRRLDAYAEFDAALSRSLVDLPIDALSDDVLRELAAALDVEDEAFVRARLGTGADGGQDTSEARELFVAHQRLHLVASDDIAPLATAAYEAHHQMEEAEAAFTGGTTPDEATFADAITEFIDALTAFEDAAGEELRR